MFKKLLITLLSFTCLQFTACSGDKNDYDNFVFETSGNTATLKDIKNKQVENIVIPEKVKIKDVEYTVDRIGENAFYGCFSLKSVTIPDSVIIIEREAFNSCESLTNVSLGNNVTFIGQKNFFRYGTNAQYINYNEYKNGYYLGNKSNPYVAFIQPRYIESNPLVLNDNCYCIENTFRNVHFYEMDFAQNEYDNALYIGNNTNPYLILTQAKDKSITSCEINPNCKMILENAFAGCECLESVTFGDSLKYIGREAFLHVIH